MLEFTPNMWSLEENEKSRTSTVPLTTVILMQFLNNVFHESMTGNKKPANHPGEEDFHQLHFCHINFPSHLHSENIWSKEIPSCKICGKNKAEHHFEKSYHMEDILRILFFFFSSSADHCSYLLISLSMTCIHMAPIL